MKRSNRIVVAAAVILAVVAACSVLKKENAEKDIRVFLTTFQGSLASTDEEILKYFESRQSKEAIISAVRILQNKEHEFIECIASFDNADITTEDKGLKVVIPVAFRTKDLDNGQDGASSIVMFVKQKDDSFVITKLEAEEFYKTFADIRNMIEWSVELKLEMREREPIYALAKVLQMKFDSVVWYTTYKTQRYFYAVNGNWIGYENRWQKRHGDPDCKMGLIDDEGNIIVPLEYDLVGTLGFHFDDEVEVKKDGKVGYFNIATKQVTIPTSYDMIIPYEKDHARAIVKQDTVYGWIDEAYQYQSGFPSAQAQKWVRSFAFFPKDLKLKADSVISFAEVPNADGAGSGIVMPPSYLVQTGIFNEVIVGISTTKVPLNGWTDYLVTDGTMLEKITDKIEAVLTTITERYLDGREEFYTYNRLAFVNDKFDTLAVSDVPTSGKISFKQIDSTLLELKFDASNFEGSDIAEYNFPEYAYFRLSTDLTVSKLESRRSFAFTQFVKIDSSYLSGEFTRYTEEAGEVQATFLSLKTLNYMRNQILADYGYRFTAEEDVAQFQYADWYKPQYDTVQECEEQMNEIDLHNLRFLDQVIAQMGTKRV
jgi:hypothetical protein